MLRDLILLSTARVIGTLGVVAMFHELSGHSPEMSRKMCFARPCCLSGAEYPRAYEHACSHRWRLSSAYFVLPI